MTLQGLWSRYLVRDLEDMIQGPIFCAPVSSSGTLRRVKRDLIKLRGPSLRVQFTGYSSTGPLSFVDGRASHSYWCLLQEPSSLSAGNAQKRLPSEKITAAGRKEAFRSP